MVNITKMLHNLSCDDRSLIVLGASRDINVSAFAHEIADHMAAIAPASCKVLYFTAHENRQNLEIQSTNRFWFERRLEQRQMGLYDYDTDGGDDIKQFPESAYQQEMKKYQDSVCGRIQSIADDEPQTVDSIKGYIRQCVECGKRPVVIIDSIEDLVPGGVRKPGKPFANAVIRALKSIQEEYGILVIAICTMTETYFMQPVDLTQFNDTEAIQDAADLVWGLEITKTNVPEVTPGKYIPREEPWLVTLKTLKTPADTKSYIAQFEYCDYYKCFVPYDPVH